MTFECAWFAAQQPQHGSSISCSVGLCTELQSQRQSKPLLTQYLALPVWLQQWIKTQLSLKLMWHAFAAELPRQGCTLAMSFLCRRSLPQLHQNA